MSVKGEFSQSWGEKEQKAYADLVKKQFCKDIKIMARDEEYEDRHTFVSPDKSTRFWLHPFVYESGEFTLSVARADARNESMIPEEDFFYFSGIMKPADVLSVKNSSKFSQCVPCAYRVSGSAVKGKDGLVLHVAFLPDGSKSKYVGMVGKLSGGNLVVFRDGTSIAVSNDDKYNVIGNIGK